MHGVPLFIEELTKTVVESGILAEAGDYYVFKSPCTVGQKKLRLEVGQLLPVSW
jgi:hypothetical protein